MSKLKLANKTNMYLVTRVDFDGNNVVVACSASQEKAYELEGEYAQMFLDKGVSQDESYFYTTITTYYS